MNALLAALVTSEEAGFDVGAPFFIRWPVQILFNLWICVLVLGLVLAALNWLWKVLVKRPVNWFKQLWARRRIFELHAAWVLGRMIWTIWLAAGWLILLGCTGTAVWALLAREWWVLAFALPPTAGSWCMRLWIVRQKW